MADHAVVTGTVTGLLSGGGGYVVVELIRSWRGRARQRLDATKAPSEIEATISAGARDAVSALRETLTEYRSELLELRAECDGTKEQLTQERQQRRAAERTVADLERQLADRDPA